MARENLAQQIAERYSAKIFNGNINTKPEEYVQALAPALDDDEAVLIVYSWEAQRVFGHMLSYLEKIVQQSAVRHRMLDRLALSLSPVFVKCMLKPQAMDVHGIGHHISVMWSNHKSLFPTIDIDLESVSFEFLCDAIDNAAPIRNGPGIGCWGPNKILLIGDRHGDTTQPYLVKSNIAFCSMSGMGCSEWLTEELMKANIQEDELYWINAYDDQGNATDELFIDELQPFQTYALGQKAQQWCDKRGLLYVRVEHPQYWKRFYYKREYPLITKLREDVWKIRRRS